MQLINPFHSYLAVKYTNTINDRSHLQGFPMENTWIEKYTIFGSH